MAGLAVADRVAASLQCRHWVAVSQNGLVRGGQRHAADGGAGRRSDFVFAAQR